MSGVDDPTRVPDVAGIRPGDRIAGRFEVTRVLGRGGMATVFEANHVELRQRVALKVLHGAPSEATKERFLREARAAFSLKSENVGRVLDVGRLPDGAPYIVMEYLEGTDLAQAFRDTRVEPGRAVDLAVQACTGLAEAHACGIIHRDVKPTNVFLSRRSDGTDLVKVIDFGISKVRDELASDEKLTIEGQVLGTPRFMAPEQFGGGDVDARADVWSMGLVIYRLLTGTLPFTGLTVAAIYAEVVNSPATDVRTHVPGLDPELARVVMRCLERDPKKRFADAGELARALEPFRSAVRVVAPLAPALAQAPPATPTDTLPEGPTASNLEIAPPAPPPVRRLPVFLGVAAVAIVVLGGGAIALVHPWSSQDGTAAGASASGPVIDGVRSVASASANSPGAVVGAPAATVEPAISASGARPPATVIRPPGKPLATGSGRPRDFLKENW